MSALEGHGVGRDKPDEIARLVAVLRSWIPDGDGHSGQYARDMAAAAHLLEQLAIQRKHHRARHTSYKRRLRELQDYMAAAPTAYVRRVYDCDAGADMGEIGDSLPVELAGKHVRLLAEGATHEP